MNGKRVTAKVKLRTWLSKIKKAGINSGATLVGGSSREGFYLSYTVDGLWVLSNANKGGQPKNMLYKSRDLDEFLDMVWSSKFLNIDWEWSNELDKRMGGKAGVVGRKLSKEGPSCVIRIPIKFRTSIKKHLEELREEEVISALEKQIEDLERGTKDLLRTRIGA